MNCIYEHRRLAGTYIAVLGAAMIVSIVGLAALMSVRINTRGAAGALNSAQARQHAHSGIQMGLWMINNDITWRSTRVNGLWINQDPIGTGTYSLEGIDPTDGNLANSTNDHLVLTATGNQGSSRFKLAVELEPFGPPGIDVLASALHSYNDVSVLADVTATAPVSADNTVINDATIDADVEAGNLIDNRGTITGTATQGVAPKETPDADLFSQYVSQATPISILDLPFNGSRFELRDLVLSPASNPYGPVDPNGIYVIDCQGSDIRIRDCRIVGTLVLIDTGSGSEILGGINWAPFLPNYPVMLVSGDITVDALVPLDEGELGINFNPIGTPKGTIQDVTLLDVYPPLIQGVTYVSNALSVVGPAWFEGVVISGNTLSIAAPLLVTHDLAIINNPPPGFEKPFRPMVPVRGTWKQIVD